MSADVRFRLVAIDLDGTLLTSERVIEDESRRAISACVERGVSVAIITGRRLPSARAFVDMLPIEPFVVANSGAIIQDDASDELLRRCLLPRDIAASVLAIATGAGVEPVVHDGPDGEGHLVLRERAKELPHVGRYLRQTSPPPVWVETFELVRDPVQIGFASGLHVIRDLAERVSSELTSTVSVVKTEYPDDDLALLDVLAPDANKAAALRFLSERTGVSMKETFAIGDNWNDVAMLRAAGMGVIMANAVDELKEESFVETKSNDEGGVADAIDRYVLIS